MVAAKDIMAQTDLALVCTDAPNVNGFYFVAAHTDSGTRFYSDPIATFEKAQAIYNSYIDVLVYFKGGNVQLYQIKEDDFDVIAYTKI